MKLVTPLIVKHTAGVAPRTGGRGLKYILRGYGRKRNSRPPHRGAWIEIAKKRGKNAFAKASPPAQGGVD